MAAIHNMFYLIIATVAFFNKDNNSLWWAATLQRKPFGWKYRRELISLPETSLFEIACSFRYLWPIAAQHITLKNRHDENAAVEICGQSAKVSSSASLCRISTCASQHHCHSTHISSCGGLCKHFTDEVDPIYHRLSPYVTLVDWCFFVLGRTLQSPVLLDWQSLSEELFERGI